MNNNLFYILYLIHSFHPTFSLIPFCFFLYNCLVFILKKYVSFFLVFNYMFITCNYLWCLRWRLYSRRIHQKYCFVFYALMFFVIAIIINIASTFWNNNDNNKWNNIVIISNAVLCCFRKQMENIEKLQFSALNITKANSISWTTNVKLHLESLRLSETIKEKNSSTSQEMAKSVIFLRRHLDESIIYDYAHMRDPKKL